MSNNQMEVNLKINQEENEEGEEIFNYQIEGKNTNKQMISKILAAGAMQFIELYESDGKNIDDINLPQLDREVEINLKVKPSEDLDNIDNQVDLNFDFGEGVFLEEAVYFLTDVVARIEGF